VASAASNHATWSTIIITACRDEQWHKIKRTWRQSAAAYYTISCALYNDIVTKCRNGEKNSHPPLQ